MSDTDRGAELTAEVVAAEKELRAVTTKVIQTRQALLDSYESARDRTDRAWTALKQHLFEQSGGRLERENTGFLTDDWFLFKKRTDEKEG